MQDVFGGDRLSPDPGFCKSNIFGDRRIEVMANHQHIQVLIQRIQGVGSSGIRRRRQHIRLTTDFDDVGCMSAACSFSVVGVDGTILERSDRIFDKSAFIQSIGMNRYLHIIFIGNAEASINCCGSGSPVFMQL